ncbi:KpsF/GutQ family sugar-phosphate isomerase [Pseudooceanicola onchidii]|uniref:KpsF/GutQ family sugar-phosphate isomerase n=1 Tax=Pseudooceanicola onchidii TaxID=2562279 RepID=UPI0010AA0F22|nr:KpsF/GutQ family sugar-phosphate isomerase [Pseudooceanicola onchidii]
MTSALDTARAVLTTESAALAQLASELTEDFADVVDTLLKVPGRVIVSGMGKSGHVAAKIAATLASTGTPAQFVHPGEASHGDLGMITRSDAVILISNSGESKELADIIAHTRRFDIPLIGVTKRADSTLSKQSDHLLQLSDAPEACAIGMAPTTSTTLTMALGDALAVALMKARGFERADYQTFHPGGTLGAQLLTVAAVMHKADALPVVTPATPMGDTLLEMSAKGFGVVAVAEDGVLRGIITDGDLRRNLKGLLDHTAGEVATANPRTIPADILLVDALGIMNDNRISALFAVDAEGRLEGLIHIHDALRLGVK